MALMDDLTAGIIRFFNFFIKMLTSTERGWAAYGRLARFGAIIFLAVCLLAFFPAAIKQHGLDQARQAGPFLNNVFPATTPSSTTTWTVQNAFPNLTFVDPVQLLEMPGTNKFLVAGKTGILWTFDKTNPATNTKATFLNISSRVITSGDGGLLGVVFHPDFGKAGNLNRGYFYVYYRYKFDPNQTNQLAYLRLSRFTLPDGASAADPNSEYVLIQQYDRQEWHNGGSMFFGPDRFLYLTIGDEGGSSDQYGSGQKVDQGLFSGLLRLDVDQDSSRSHPIRRQPISVGPPPTGWPGSFSQGYFIPDDNPWLDPNGSILEEFWAIGLRSPHRMYYDSVTKWIWFGDVGQGNKEEVNIIKKGYNHQWSYKEGTSNTARPKPNPVRGIEAPPVFEYPRSFGVCVIGGLVYRGNKWASQLGGKYIFGDHGTRNVYTLDYDSVTNVADVQFLLNVPAGGSGNKNGISHFYADSLGDIYVLKLHGTNQNGGIIYKFVPVVTSNEPPALLSQTGAFKNLSTLEPADGLIPYQLNVPFWSDNALKYRWIMIPNDGTHDSPAEQITFSSTGEWQYPVGTVLVKHFELRLDEANPNSKRRLETRFLVHGTDGKYYGFTYRWRDDQSDADLLSGSRIDTFSVTTPVNGNRELTWYYPDRQQCLFCHNDAAGGVLGPKARQLNGDAFYHETGRTANQLVTYRYLNMFSSAVDTSAAALASLLTSRATNDPTASLEDRARAYLDANCASCHRPGVSVQAQFDTRLSTPLDAQGLIYGQLLTSLGLSDPRVIVPADLNASVLYKRVNSVHRTFSMPPLAKNMIDSVGAQLIHDWISNMSPAYTPPGNVVVADFQDAFQGGSPATGWSYLWNQGGAIGNSANYAALQWNGTNYDSDGAPGTPDATQLRYGNLSSTGGHPGPGSGQSNGGNISRYVIAAYTVGLAGTYEITNSTLTDANTGCGDGGDVRVYVNNTLKLSASYPNGGSANFNGSLGTLQPGDQVYVAVGPGTSNDNCDAFNLDFSVRRVTGLPGQRIVFPAIPNQISGAGPFALQATASSGLSVTYQVISGPASISGNLLTPGSQSGWVTVRASQSGNGSFAAAPSVERRFWVAPTGKAQGTGLFASYYHDIAKTQLAFTRVDTAVDFYWGSASPDPSMEYNTYAVVWEGEIEVPFSGQWEFFVTADDGVRLFVNDLNTPLIDAWQDQATTERTASVTLSAWQRVPVRLEYYENRVYSEVMFEWSHSSLGREVVPRSFLYPSAGNVFPVELLSFEAIPQNNHVNLQWATLTEAGASHFFVERSVDGEHFESLERVRAKGNSQSVQEYTTVDPSPYRGTSYYRLKQVDLNGQFTYSQIETVVLYGTEISVFPNPASREDELQVHMSFPGIQPVEVRLVDARGITHFRQVIGEVQRRHLVSVPLDGLAAGVYLLVASNGGVREVRKVVVR